MITLSDVDTEIANRKRLIALDAEIAKRLNTGVDDSITPKKTKE